MRILWINSFFLHSVTYICTSVEANSVDDRRTSPVLIYISSRSVWVSGILKGTRRSFIFVLFLRTPGLCILGYFVWMKQVVCKALGELLLKACNYMFFSTADLFYTKASLYSKTQPWLVQTLVSFSFCFSQWHTFF